MHFIQKRKHHGCVWIRQHNILPDTEEIQVQIIYVSYEWCSNYHTRENITETKKRVIIFIEGGNLHNTIIKGLLLYWILSGSENFQFGYRLASYLKTWFDYRPHLHKTQFTSLERNHPLLFLMWIMFC